MDEQRYRAAEAAVWEHWGAAPTEHWVRLGTSGPRLRVQEVGDPDGPAILFVHGAAIAGTCWADLASRLSDHRCLLLDRPGCGLSEPMPAPPGVEGLPSLADDILVDVLDDLGVERSHLVSNSMGGLFTLRTAAAHPRRVDSVVHFGWSLGAPPDDLPLVMHLAGAPGIGWLMAHVPVPRAGVVAMLRAGGMAGAVDAGRIPEVAIQWNAAVQNHTDTRIHEYRFAAGAGLRRQIEALQLPDDVLGAVSVPVHIVLGTGDPFGTVPSMQSLADRLPHGQLEVWDGAGHAAWLDDLDRAERTVRDVLATR